MKPLHYRGEHGDSESGRCAACEATSPDCERCWTGRYLGAFRASGRLPIASVKRSIFAMAAAGGSARDQCCANVGRSRVSAGHVIACLGVGPLAAVCGARVCSRTRWRRTAEVPGTVGEVRDLALVRRRAAPGHGTSLMAHEHPRGAGPFVGPQLRYLVGSGHGWLGGVGFAACARRLRARDAWIGWDDTRRRAHLHPGAGTVPELLIRPDISCRNLASHVLGRVARASWRRLRAPLRLSPVAAGDRSSTRPNTPGRACGRRTGCSVGEDPLGAGAIDRTHAAARNAFKAVYVYALEPAWRARLAVPAPGIAPLAAGDGLDAGSWADHEFGGAPLGDARLSARLVQSAQHMAQSPMRAITGATNGARALVKGHYRLIDQPAEMRGDGGEHSRTPSRAHAAPICGRMTRCCRIQDGTRPELHPAAARRGGWGPCGSNQTGAAAARPWTQCTRRWRSIPTGWRWASCGRRSTRPSPRHPRRRASPKPRRGAEVDSAGSRGCATARRQPSSWRRPGWCARWTARPTSSTCSSNAGRTPRRSNCWSGRRSTAVLDREKTCRRAHGLASVCSTRYATGRPVAPPRSRCGGRARGRRPANRLARTAVRARVAEVTLRYQPVALPCPGAEPVELFVVHAREQQAPPAVEPLEWFVLTTRATAPPSARPRSPLRSRASRTRRTSARRTSSATTSRCGCRCAGSPA